MSSSDGDGTDSVAKKRHSRRELLRSSAVFSNIRTRDGKVVISKTQQHGGGQTPDSGTERFAHHSESTCLSDPLTLMSGCESLSFKGALIPEGRNRDSFVTDVVNLYARVSLFSSFSSFVSDNLNVCVPLSSLVLLHAHEWCADRLPAFDRFRV